MLDDGAVETQEEEKAEHWYDDAAAGNLPEHVESGIPGDTGAWYTQSAGKVGGGHGITGEVIDAWFGGEGVPGAYHLEPSPEEQAEDVVPPAYAEPDAPEPWDVDEMS